MAYFDSKDEIQCPSCKENHRMDDWYPSEGEEITIECECGKDFTVSASYSIHLTTQCGNEETHNCVYQKKIISGQERWSTDGKKIYAECVNCEETNFVDPELLSSSTQLEEGEK